MYRNLSAILALVVMLISTTGCALIEPARNVWRENWKAFRPRGLDYRDPTAESDDDWSEVGEIGRGDQPFEKDPVPWLRDALSSPKARSIERNFRVE